MVSCMLECMNSLVSALMLLALVTYVFAVYIINHVAEVMLAGEEGQIKESIYWHEGNHDYLIMRFGTLGRTMLSLYQAVTGGNSWGDLTAALMATTTEPIYFGIFFAAFEAFTGIALLNIVTGIFVDNAVKATLQDKDMAIQDELAMETSYMNNMKRMFREADLDSSGQLSWKELEKYLEDDRAKAYFNHLELDPSAAKGLFQLLDTDGSDSVSCDEFVLGCARLKGGARNVDVATLLYENKKMLHEFSRFMTNCIAELQDIIIHENKVDAALLDLTTVDKRFDELLERVGIQKLLLETKEQEQRNAAKDFLGPSECDWAHESSFLVGPRRHKGPVKWVHL